VSDAESRLSFWKYFDYILTDVDQMQTRYVVYSDYDKIPIISPMYIHLCTHMKKRKLHAT
jgi:hypothetical protein